MASNTIKGSEAIKKLTDLYTNLAGQIDKATTETNEFLAATKKLPSDYLKTIEKLKNLQKEHEEALSKLSEEQKKLTAEQKEAKRLTDQRIKSEAKLVQATSKEAKELQKVRVELQKTNKTQKDNARLSSKLTTEYEKQSIILNRLRLQYKNVVLIQGAASKEAIRLGNAVTKLDQKLKKVDAAAGQFGRVVGNYPKLLGGAISSLKAFASAFGFTSAIFILAQTVRNTIGVFNAFDQSQADLAAILGVNREGISELTEQAKQLGATTAFTATQVAELQLELSKLGFTTDEILDATLGIENLALATGVDAARAAKLGGAALRGFALDASEANRVASVLAISTTKSASSFETLEVALPKVSAIAKSFGFTIEDTTALLGGLQNAGFEASTSGTSLRQIFLQLADSNGKLAKKLGGGAKNFDELIDQFKRLDEEGISLGEAFDLTNARSVAAFKVFLQGAEDIRELRNSIVDVEGELDVLAEQKLDSVQGRMKLLNSAWEGWILNMDRSGKGAEKIKRAIDFLTKNLDKILSTLIKVGKAFLIYKTILIATSIITRAYTASIVILRVAKIALAGGIGKATIAMRALNISIIANPIGLLLSVLAGGVAIWLAFREGVDETAEAMMRLKKSSDAATKAIVDNTLTQIESQLAQIDSESKNQEEANNQKIDLLTKNIKEQEDGVAGLYTSLDEIAKEGEEEISRTVGQKLDERKQLFDKYYTDLALFNAGKLKEIPAFPSVEPLTQEEIRISEERSSIRTDAEKKLIKKLRAIRLRFLKQVVTDEVQADKDAQAKKDKAAEARKKKREKEALEQLKARQQLSLLTLKDEIKRLNQSIKNQENSSASIINDIRVRTEKEIELANIANDFIVLNNKLKGDKLILQERKLQNELTDIILKSQQDIEKIRSRKDPDVVEEDDFDIGFDTRLFLINELVKLNEQSFDELAKLYDEDLDAFLKLANAKLNVSQEFASAEAQLIEQRKQLQEQVGKESLEFTKTLLNALLDAKINSLNEELESERNKANTLLEFNAGNSEAQAEIKRQLAEKEKVILDRKEALERKAFLLNQAFQLAEVAITTAKSIAAIKAQAGILAANPVTAGLAALALSQIPLVIAGGALAAGTILAQSIPAFKDGGITPGGEVLVNDNNTGNFKEIIKTPDGKILRPQKRNTILDLPKGSEVFKNENEFEKELKSILNGNNILSERSILPVINIDNGLSKEDYNKGVNSLKKAISSNKGGSLHFDERGYTKYLNDKAGRTKILNNRFQIKGNNV